MGAGGWKDAARLNAPEAFPRTSRFSLRACTSSDVGPLAASQTPTWQTRRPSHASALGHGVPSGTSAPGTQAPAWHEPAARHALSVSQAVPSATRGPCRQIPAWHVSSPLQGSPSSHDVPSGCPGHGPPGGRHYVRWNGFSDA